MNRRDALKYTASVMGVSILGAEVFLSGCANRNDQNEFLSEEDVRLLDEIGETILPRLENHDNSNLEHAASGLKRHADRHCESGDGELRSRD